MEMLGLYPTWLEPMLGSGWVVAVISTIHVLASHTSVGAAMVFAYLAVVAYRYDKPELLDYIKKYSAVRRGECYRQHLLHSQGRNQYHL